MFENNFPITLRTSIFMESLKSGIFYTFFILYGILRLLRAALLLCLNNLFRIGLAGLFYGSLLVIISLALVIVLSYYLIAVFGSQIRLP